MMRKLAQLSSPFDNRLADEQTDAVYASSMGHSVETARILAKPNQECRRARDTSPSR